MKLLEQYLQAIGTKLSWRSREEIKAELRSVLMDEIEAKHGEAPTEEQVESIIVEFGSPTAVAARYRGERLVIGAGLTDLYFLIIALMFGAMTLAFTVVFLLKYLPSYPASGPLLPALLQIPANVLSGTLGGIGAVTLVFVVLSRVLDKRALDLNDHWHVDELKAIDVVEKFESKFKSIVTIGLIALPLVVLNIFPGTMTAAEDAFALSPLTLGHRIVVSEFEWYLRLLTVFWSGRIIAELVVLRTGIRGPGVRVSLAILYGLEALMAGILLTDADLYTDVTGWIGFKTVFAIALVANIGETGSNVVHLIRAKWLTPVKSMS